MEMLSWMILFWFHLSNTFCVSVTIADSFRHQDCFLRAVMQQGFQGKRIDHVGVDFREAP